MPMPTAQSAGPISLARACDFCMENVLSLRRHDPDQVLRVFLSPSTILAGTPRNKANVGAGPGLSMRAVHGCAAGSFRTTLKSAKQGSPKDRYGAAIRAALRQQFNRRRSLSARVRARDRSAPPPHGANRLRAGLVHGL